LAVLLSVSCLAASALAVNPGLPAARASSRVPEWALMLCRAPGRVVLRTTAAGVVVFRLPHDPFTRFACLRGKRYAVSFDRPLEGTTNGSADLQFVGPFMTIQIYGSGCGSGACEGPEGWLIDLRTARVLTEGRRFGRVVRIRANRSGDAALIVRDSPGPDLDSGYPPGPGPFRVDITDRKGRRTIDRGSGIDPGSLNVSGRLVTWLHDGAQRRAMLAEHPTPPASR